MVKPGNRSSLVSLHCPCPHHRAPLQEDLPRLLTAHLTHSALPGLPCLLEETSRSSRQLSELPGSGELDVRQIHCLVLSEPWQRRENRRESGGQNQTVHEPCQHCGQARPMMVTSEIHTPHSSPSHQPASQPALQVWLLPEVPKTLANVHPQGRVPALMADQEPVWPSPYLHFKQEILAHNSERY